MPAGKQKTQRQRRVSGAEQPHPHREAATHRQTHTHSTWQKCKKTSQPKPDEMGAGCRPDGGTREFRRSCVTCVFADPVSRCPGIWIWVLALYLSSDCLEKIIKWVFCLEMQGVGGNDNRILLSRSTRLLKCLVVRSGSGGRGDSKNRRLALAFMLSSRCSSVPGHAIGATHRPPRRSWPCRPPIARHAHETISRPVTSKPIHAIPSPEVRQQNPVVRPIGIADCMREPSWSILRRRVGRGVGQDGKLMQALREPWVVNGTAGRDRE